MMHILANPVKVKGLRQLVWPLDESQGLSQLHGHGPWLVYEMAQRLSSFFLLPGSEVMGQGLHVMFSFFIFT